MLLIFWQISSYRESKSDDRRFYIFTATKTLHLRTESKKDREAWIEALVSTRSLFSLRPLNDSLSLVPNDLSVSTERLKSRLLEEGVQEGLVRECEQIMLSEFSEIQGQVKVLCEERSNLLDTLRQLEVTLLLIISNALTMEWVKLGFPLNSFFIPLFWSTVALPRWGSLDLFYMKLHFAC